MKNIAIIPEPIKHLEQFIDLLKQKKPFSFVRFSDGEIEILRNRYLEIAGGKTIFRGREFKNNFPKFDSKKFDPSIHQDIRRDLLESAFFRDMVFFKGIPTTHNNAIKDREFLLRLNGGFEHNMTFSDLFLNSNYKKYREEMVPLYGLYNKIYVIANYRAKPVGILENAKHIEIPDNFFANYNDVLNQVYNRIRVVEKGSLILSSASSLSNIIGNKLFLERKDITFLDIGTSINDLLSLDHNTRAYHSEEKSWFKRIFYRQSKGYQIKW